jgi:beta-galactosidase
MVYLVSHTWTGRQGEPGEKKSLKVYSNCETVELFVNGKSAGSQRGGTSVWQVTLQAGDNDVRAVGSQGGRQVQDSVRIRY